MRRRIDSAIRAALDVALSAVVIALLMPLLVVVALLIKTTSRGPVLFVQHRTGRRGRPFPLLKFRTMVADAPARGPAITIGADPRVTAVGAFLRRCKLDEVPQLINVIAGHMSLVGPRPEVPRYVDGYSEAQRKVLEVKPGLTDPASLAFRDESHLLAGLPDPERAYREEILPKKLALSLAYLEHRTLLSDLRVVGCTVLAVFGLAAPTFLRSPGADDRRCARSST